MSNKARVWAIIKTAGAMAAFAAIWIAVASLLVGSRFLPDGRHNLFFDNRIRAATDLFRTGKVDYLVVSGDNHIRGYDEPTDMKESLIVAGVPPDRIYSDYAGFRTMDSIVRVRKSFGQTAVTVVSQKFHNERAIFIAQHSGVDAIGFNAPEVDAYNSFKTKCRDSIARANMLLDIFIFRRGPKLLGDSVTLPN